MSEPMILAIVAASSALLGGLLNAFFNKWSQDREFSRKTKREFYDTLLDQLWESNLASEPKDRAQHAAQFLKMSTKIAIYGSDQVVSRMADVTGITNLYEPEDQRKITLLIAAMRADLGNSLNSVIEQDIAQIVFERPNRNRPQGTHLK